ncbi:hypothetical protein ABW19_dt0203259 [Dactylella cylindrospora]|nr:hypothetical protein ABW19_dt0203259 [Dactylella cylindrospora]
MLQRSIIRSRPLVSRLTCNSYSHTGPRLALTTSNRISLSSRLQPHAQTRAQSTTSIPAPSRTRPFYKSPIFTLPAVLLLAYTAYEYSTQPPYQPINPDTFTPYTITSSTSLSPTSSIITLRPKCNKPPPDSFWSSIEKAGIWSVQIKQPQLQIQREYTPIPNPHQSDENEIKLFVRAVSNGEVSPYLLSRKPGDVVEIRGPVISYSWAPPSQNGETQGDRQKVGDVVFIAGGTGIAPALQIAMHILRQEDGKKRNLTILYASRSSEETIIPNLKELEGLKSGKIKVDVKYFYDDKATFIKRSDIETALESFGRGEGKGRDVLFISGPEGFITHYAGKKGWEGGVETQGILGGIIGDILKKRKQGSTIEVMKL